MTEANAKAASECDMAAAVEPMDAPELEESQESKGFMPLHEALALYNRRQEELRLRREAYDREVDAYHARLAEAVAERDARDRAEYRSLRAAHAAEVTQLYVTHVQHIGPAALRRFYEIMGRPADERPLLSVPDPEGRIDWMRLFKRDWETYARMQKAMRTAAE